MKHLMRTLFLLALGTILPLSGCAPETSESSFDKSLVSSIALEPSVLVMEVGETEALTVTIEYKDGLDHDAPLRWTTGDPFVATVENGFVTATGSGSTSISVLAGYKMATCLVTVEGDTPYIPGSSTDSGGFAISLNHTREQLLIGESLTLVATTSEEAAVSWSSSKPDVASVDNGLVRALSLGETTITASANGSSASCLISVVSEIDDEFDCEIYFFIDYNNIDVEDTTGTKLLASFSWYTDRPIGESGKVPNDPTTAMDPAFPYFIGWSDHTIIDSKDDLWDMDTDLVGNFTYLFLYGIWSDVPKGEFNK